MYYCRAWPAWGSLDMAHWMKSSLTGQGTSRDTSTSNPKPMPWGADQSNACSLGDHSQSIQPSTLLLSQETDRILIDLSSGFGLNTAWTKSNLQRVLNLTYFCMRDKFKSWWSFTSCCVVFAHVYCWFLMGLQYYYHFRPNYHSFVTFF